MVLCIIEGILDELLFKFTWEYCYMFKHVMQFYILKKTASRNIICVYWDCIVTCLLCSRSRAQSTRKIIYWIIILLSSASFDHVSAITSCYTCFDGLWSYPVGRLFSLNKAVNLRSLIFDRIMSICKQF